MEEVAEEGEFVFELIYEASAMIPSWSGRIAYTFRGRLVVLVESLVLAMIEEYSRGSVTEKCTSQGLMEWRRM